MADFRHISKALSQANKGHKGHSKGNSVGGKVETRNVMSGNSNAFGLNKEQRFHAMNEQRKIQREDLLMKRRGLNFVTEHHEELLDQTVISVCEEQLDNVAPKIVAILALSEDCETQEVRQTLVEHCLQYTELQKSHKNRREIDEIMENEEKSQFKAYLCPNPGASSNMASRKQRLIFLEMNRNDPYSIMDVAKVADMVIVVMSCRKTNVTGVKQDPFEHAKAIDELGYRALSLIRSQGLPNMIGVLQHIEHVSSSKHSMVKKLFQRMFESEFTDKYKFMGLNRSTATLLNNDSNALLRQIAVHYPEDLTWRKQRSYMLGEVTHAREDEVHIKGYIKQNYLNAKRLIHITGIGKLGWKIKRIEVAQDPCPVKLTNNEKDKVLSTSKAQSIVSSRKTSRESSRRGSLDENDKIKQVIDPLTQKKCVQTITDKERDNGEIENNPGLFAAEQTWPTTEELKRKERKGSLDQQEEMVDMDHEIDLSQIKPKQGGADELAGLMEKMQIKVVGRETGKDSDYASSGGEDDEESDGGADELNTTAVAQEPISNKHTKFTDLESRAREDMDFPDEVDTPFVNAAARFQKYRGIKSLKNCDWDPYENLPAEYSKLWRFSAYQQAYKDSVQQTVEEGLPLNGTYLTLVLEISPQDIDNFPQGKALILSTLFPNEAKVSTMSFKIKRSVENKDIVPSKRLMEFHCGFRRFECKPIFSSETNPGAATEKYKFNRFLHPEHPSIATIYSPIIFAPCKILCFTEESMKSGKANSIVAVGQVLAPNPLKCILKRIVLTGYPLRVHKKKATIRYMFFNPTDIKYFKPVQLQSKAGLSGHIKQPCGTHGLMKCVFNDYIKHSDVVVMPLYRRVFPVWYPRTWDANAVLEDKHQKFDAEEEKDTTMADE